MLDVMEPVIAGECFDCVSVVFIVCFRKTPRKWLKGVRITFFCVINELIKFAALCHLELKKYTVVGVNCRLFRE